MKIEMVRGRQVWDSRGRPTVEVEVDVIGGSRGRAIAPAGASTGSGEALDLRDGGARLGGYGVNKVLRNIALKIAPALVGQDVQDQAGVDGILTDLDGSDNFSELGGNAAIATSLAVSHAAAASNEKPLWRHLRGDANAPILLPVPEIQIFGGGAHANGQMDIQDFMIVPFGAGSFSQALEWTAEIYLAAGKLLDEKGLRFGVADEGGYWPVFSSNEMAIELLAKSIESAGFSLESEVRISLDIAATQFFCENGYRLSKDAQTITEDEWYERLASWLRNYPILMIEDPFHEHDFERHARLCAEFGSKMQIVGDDLLVTNVDNIERAQTEQACNTLLCKPNQAGTLSAAKQASDRALNSGWDVVVSARSGETEDVSIVHLVVGWGVHQLKVGSFSRSERMAKWNAVLRIADELGASAGYAGDSVFGKFLRHGASV